MMKRFIHSRRAGRNMRDRIKKIEAGNFRIAAASDRGLLRSRNEDFYGIFSPGQSSLAMHGILLVVADGMGGHLSGAEASKLAVESLSRAYFKDISQGASAAIVDRIRWAMHEANREVFEIIGERIEGTVGTTCTAAVLSEDRVTIAHLGDSRAYRLTSGKILQLTKDHSLVGEMVRRGTLSREEADRHPSRNFITRALGLRESIEVDVEEYQLEAGDRILLCSDGLFTMVSEKEISSIAVEGTPQEACKRLIERANDEGGEDNITVIVAERML